MNLIVSKGVSVKKSERKLDSTFLWKFPNDDVIIILRVLAAEISLKMIHGSMIAKSVCFN